MSRIRIQSKRSFAESHCDCGLILPTRGPCRRAAHGCTNSHGAGYLATPYAWLCRLLFCLHREALHDRTKPPQDGTRRFPLKGDLDARYQLADGRTWVGACSARVFPPKLLA